MRWQKLMTNNDRVRGVRIDFSLDSCRSAEGSKRTIALEIASRCAQQPLGSAFSAGTPRAALRGFDRASLVPPMSAKIEGVCQENERKASALR